VIVSSGPVWHVRPARGVYLGEEVSLRPDGGTASRTARVSGVKWNLKEAETRRQSDE